MGSKKLLKWWNNVWFWLFLIWNVIDQFFKTSPHSLLLCISLRVHKASEKPTPKLPIHSLWFRLNFQFKTNAWLLRARVNFGDSTSQGDVANDLKMRKKNWQFVQKKSKWLFLCARVCKSIFVHIFLAVPHLSVPLLTLAVYAIRQLFLQSSAWSEKPNEVNMDATHCCRAAKVPKNPR